jgi:hypothetical protein
MAHITTWEEDYKGNNTSPSLQSPLANSLSPSCIHERGTYRGISLSSALGKIFSGIKARSLRDWIPNYKFSFLVHEAFSVTQTTPGRMEM